MKKISKFIFKIIALYVLTLIIWRKFIKFDNTTNGYYNDSSGISSSNNSNINLYESIPIVQSNIFNINHNLSYYVSMLHQSIRVMELSDDLNILTINKCNHLWRPKLPLIDHQHGIEIIFPNILYDMSISAKNGKCDINPIWDDNQRKQSPILYYVRSYVYHAIYCTDKKNYKEDWTKRDPYWLEVSKYITTTKEWKNNMGTDFLIPASHPESSPSRHHPTALGVLKRATFLKTDFDVSGYDTKDIIVPYLSEKITAKDSDGLNRPILGFFAGSDNPKNGLRSMLSNELKTYLKRSNKDNVIFTTDKVSDYLDKMKSSKFCFIVRGDTSSSRRLFTAIATGCIPVIISDWIVLPFAELIDYSKFTITFPESIVNNVESMINHLHDISMNMNSFNGKYIEMMTFLKESKKYLLYDYVNEGMKSILNPATLTFIEAILKRKKYCLNIATENSQLCKRLI